MTYPKQNPHANHSSALRKVRKATKNGSGEVEKQEEGKQQDHSTPCNRNLETP